MRIVKPWWQSLYDFFFQSRESYITEQNNFIEAQKNIISCSEIFDQ